MWSPSDIMWHAGWIKQLLLILMATSIAKCEESLPYEFPEGFTFGVATAAYQVEGAWNVGGKGENIWDEFSHKAGHITDKSTGDVADDSYDQHKRDVQMLSYMGVDFYRFSISWSRVLPTGFIDKPNPIGINYYHALIDELLASGITPVVTMYHWDLPEPLEDLGGWPNVKMADYFEDYADFLFKTFGDKIKTWITFNEPKQTCLFGYGNGLFAPGIKSPGVGDYLCVHTVLISHGRIYKLYSDKYRKEQKGRVGITIDLNWAEPKTNSTADIKAADTTLQFQTGLYAHPIFSKEGDYPAIVKEVVASRSKSEGLKRSRLPSFTEKQLANIRGSADFFGLNHYTSNLVEAIDRPDTSNMLSVPDLSANLTTDPSWPGSKVTFWLKVRPIGMRRALNWLYDQYGDIEILITENGFSTHAGLRDQSRIDYIHDNLQNVLDAIDDGVNVTGYTVWSLEDNFEWIFGYQQRFGLYEVDYDSPNRTRTPRDSVEYYKKVILTGLLDPTQQDVDECYAQYDRQ